MIWVPGWRAFALVGALYLLECVFTQEVEVPLGQRRGEKIFKNACSYFKIWSKWIFFIFAIFIIVLILVYFSYNTTTYNFQSEQVNSI